MKLRSMSPFAAYLPVSIVMSFVMSMFILSSSVASAIVEVNVGYSGIASTGAGGNWTIPGASYSGAYGLTAEFRLNIPLSGLNFGVRYTNLGLNESYNGYTLAMANSCVSGLVGYRLINTGLLLGPVFTYGISNNGTLQNSFSSTGTNTSTASSVTQYTAGLEAGIKFPLLVAVELGYGSLVMSGFSNSQTLFGSSTSINLNGTYARASVGFSF